MVIQNLDRDVSRKISSHQALRRPCFHLVPLSVPERLHAAGVLLSIQMEEVILSDLKRKLNGHISTLVTMATPFHPLLTLPYNYPQCIYFSLRIWALVSQSLCDMQICILEMVSWGLNPSASLMMHE